MENLTIVELEQELEKLAEMEENLPNNWDELDDMQQQCYFLNIEYGMKWIYGRIETLKQ